MASLYGPSPVSCSAAPTRSKSLNQPDTQLTNTRRWDGYAALQKIITKAGKPVPPSVYPRTQNNKSSNPPFCASGTAVCTTGTAGGKCDVGTAPKPPPPLPKSNPPNAPAATDEGAAGVIVVEPNRPRRSSRGFEEAFELDGGAKRSAFEEEPPRPPLREEAASGSSSSKSRSCIREHE